MVNIQNESVDFDSNLIFDYYLVIIKFEYN